MKAFILGILFIITISVLPGCRNKAELDSNGIPGKLVIAVYTGGDNPLGVKAMTKKLKTYFEKKAWHGG